MIAQLDSAIFLNQTLQNPEIGEEYRNWLHTSLDAVVESLIPRVGEELRARQDPDLSAKYMDFIFEFDNSEREDISISMGQLLLDRPSILLQALPRVPQEDRSIVFRRLETGWGLVTTEIPLQDAQRLAGQRVLDLLRKIL